MTDLLDEAEALLAKATPGPWTSHLWNSTDAELAEAERTEVEDLIRGANGARVVGASWYDGMHINCTEEDAALIARAPTLIAELVARVREVERDKERAEAALALVAPDALPFQLFLDDGVPMFGRVSLVSPYLFATKPEGPDTAFAGAREVYQYTYDEDTQHEAEHCTVGYFVTEDWLCERDEGAEEKYDEALARAELAETKHASCEAHLRLVTEERERFAEQREDWRARSIANEERAEQAEKERDALKLIASDLARRAVEANEEIRRLRARMEHYKRACITTSNEVTRVLGEALYGPNPDAWSTHTPEAIADEAAEEIGRLRAENDRLRAQIAIEVGTRDNALSEYRVAECRREEACRDRDRAFADGAMLRAEIQRMRGEIITYQDAHTTGTEIIDELRAKVEALEAIAAHLRDEQKGGG